MSHQAETEDGRAPTGDLEGALLYGVTPSVVNNDYESMQWRDGVLPPTDLFVCRTPTVAEFIEGCKEGAFRLHVADYLKNRADLIETIGSMKAEEFEEYKGARPISKEDLLRALQLRLENEAAALSTRPFKLPLVLSGQEVTLDIAPFMELDTTQGIFKGSEFRVRGNYFASRSAGDHFIRAGRQSRDLFLKPIKPQKAA